MTLCLYVVRILKISHLPNFWFCNTNRALFIKKNEIPIEQYHTHTIVKREILGSRESQVYARKMSIIHTKNVFTQTNMYEIHFYSEN